MIHLFSGFDTREAVGYHTFSASVIDKASHPVGIFPLHLSMLPFYKGGERDGTNAFIYSRFLIPYMMGYKGFAIFVDGADMIVRGDIAELDALCDPWKAVQVVKHDYKTKHPRKYVGTGMEADNRDYERKNWSSVMIINCGHYNWARITPETIDKMSGADLHRFAFIDERFIGELPKEWNWLCDEYGPNPDAKLLHWTAGIPGFPHYKDAPHADEWFAANAKVNHAIK